MPVDLAKIKNDLAKFSSGNFWKPKTGKNYIRILPPYREDIPVYYYAVRLHWVSSRYVLCTGDGCIVCSMLQDSAFAMVLKDKVQTMNKFLVNMIDLENPSAGVQVWSMPVTVWRSLNQYFLDPKWGDLTDVNQGRNITIVREGTGAKDTKYQVYPDPEPTPVDPTFLSGLKDLSTIFEEIPFEEIAELLQNENVRLTPASVGQSLPTPGSTPPWEGTPGSQQPVTPSTQSSTPNPQPAPSAPPQSPPPDQPAQASPAVETPSSDKSSSGQQFDPQKMQALLNKLMNK
ncbi:hypothetical protein J7J18_06750 [bacterium]|nr:hypothetical protein [bacterium]